MGQAGDFEEGEADGTVDALAVLAAAAKSVLAADGCAISEEDKR